MSPSLTVVSSPSLVWDQVTSDWDDVFGAPRFLGPLLQFLKSPFSGHTSQSSGLSQDNFNQMVFVYFHMVLEIEPKALHIVGKHVATRLSPSPHSAHIQNPPSIQRCKVHGSASSEGPVSLAAALSASFLTLHIQ